MRQRAVGATDLLPGVRAWVDQAVTVYADREREKQGGPDTNARERMAVLWKWRSDDPMAVLVFGEAARTRAAQTTYQLGLCKHEIAACLQAKQDLAGRGGAAEADAEHKTLVDDWKDAEEYWKDYVESYADQPGIVSAQLLRAEARALQGQKKEAIKMLQEAAAATTGLEKLACLWLAKQLAERS